MCTTARLGRGVGRVRNTICSNRRRGPTWGGGGGVPCKHSVCAVLWGRFRSCVCVQDVSREVSGRLLAGSREDCGGFEIKSPGTDRDRVCY